MSKHRVYLTVLEGGLDFSEVFGPFKKINKNAIKKVMSLYEDLADEGGDAALFRVDVWPSGRLDISSFQAGYMDDIRHSRRGKQ